MISLIFAVAVGRLPRMRTIPHRRQVRRDYGQIRTFRPARPTFEPLAPPCETVVNRAHFEQFVETDKRHALTAPASQLGGDDILQPAGDAIKTHRVTLAMFSSCSTDSVRWLRRLCRKATELRD